MKKKMWAKFRGDLQNSGQSCIDLSRIDGGLKTKFWKYKTNGLIWSSPIIDEKDNIYFGSTDGYFYSLNYLGKLRWKYKIKEGPDSIIDSAATFAPKNVIVVPGGDGFLHCLDRRTGKKKWLFAAYHAHEEDREQRKVVNSFEGNVVYNEDLNLIFAGSDNGCIYAIGEDGKEVWHFETGLMVWALPVFEQKNRWMAVGSLDGFLYFLEPKTGRLLWKKALSGEIKATPVYDNKHKLLFVATSLGYFYTVKINYSQKKGVGWQEIFIKKYDAEIYSSPTLVKNKVVVATMKGQIDCWDFSGKNMWSYLAKAPIASSPVLSADGQLIFGEKNGYLESIDAKMGKLLWFWETNSSFHRVNLDSSPAITSRGLVVIGSYDGNLYAVSPLYIEEQKKIKKNIAKQFVVVTNNMVREIIFDAKNAGNNGLYSLYSPLKLKICDHEKGDLSEVVFARKYNVQFFPKVDFESSISSDGKYIYVVPKQYWKPDCNYRLKIEAHIIKKRSLWNQVFSITDGALEKTLEFKTPGIGKESDFVFNKERILIHSFFIHSPRALDTYAAAAFFNQKMWLDMLKLDGRNVVRALMTPWEKKGFATPHVLTGEHIGSHFRLMGGFDLSVMGATLSVSKFYLANYFDEKKREQDTDLIFQIPLLSIKENKKEFRFPSELLKGIIDWRFKIVGAAECKMSFLS